MHRPHRIRPAALALVLALLASPGCLHSGELSGVRRDLEMQLPGSSFEKNVELSLGPVLLSVTRLVTRFVPDAEEARPFLRGVSRVQIGVYKTEIDSLPALRMRRANLLNRLPTRRWRARSRPKTARSPQTA